MSHDLFRYVPQIEQVDLDLPRKVVAMLAERDRQLEDYLATLHPGGGMLSILTKRKTSAQNYPGGYQSTTVLFNSTDAGGFGTGLSYEESTGRIVIDDAAAGWYQAVGKLSTAIPGGSPSRHQGHIRIAVDRDVTAGPPDPVAVASTYADNEDTWLSAASEPFHVPSYTELFLTVAHDVLDSGTSISIDDAQDGTTSLSVWRIL